jgi:hypothetical protein
LYLLLRFWNQILTCNKQNTLFRKLTEQLFLQTLSANCIYLSTLVVLHDNLCYQKEKVRRKRLRTSDGGEEKLQKK